MHESILFPKTDEWNYMEMTVYSLISIVFLGDEL